MAFIEKTGRYRIWQRLKELRKTLKWLYGELKKRGYDVGYSHLSEYINGDECPRADDVCAVADSIIAEYERNKK